MRTWNWIATSLAASGAPGGERVPFQLTMARSEQAAITGPGGRGVGVGVGVGKGVCALAVAAAMQTMAAISIFRM